MYNNCISRPTDRNEEVTDQQHITGYNKQLLPHLLTVPNEELCFVLDLKRIHSVQFLNETNAYSKTRVQTGNKH